MGQVLDQGALRLIRHIELTAPASTINFPNIRQDYRHLQIVGQLRSDRAAVVDDTLLCRFNGSSASVYSGHDRFRVGDASGGDSALVGQTEFIPTLRMPAANALAGMALLVDAFIPNYTGTTFAKNFRVESQTFQALASTDMYFSTYNGFFNDTSAITRVEFLPIGPNFVAGSFLSLYGIA